MKKFCDNCGNEVSPDSKFCTNCGHSFIDETSVGAPTNSGKAATIEIDLTKVNPGLKQYWDFLKSTALKPSQSLDFSASNNGWLQFGVISLVLGLIVTLLASNPYVSSFKIFLTTFIAFAVIFAIMILSAFLVVTYLKKHTSSFKTIATQLAGLFSPVVFLLVAVFLFSALEAYSFAAFLLALSGFLAVIAFNIYLYTSPNNNTKIDSLYLIVIGNAIFILISSLVSAILFEILFEEVFENLSYFLF